MKYILILSLLMAGCDRKLKDTTYKAMTCNREGCNDLDTFKEYGECMDMLKSIDRLHKLRNDKPLYVMVCKEIK